MGPRFLKAVALANDMHQSQLRKGTKIPFISHLLAVAGIVMEAGGDEDLVIAALLHDAVEDAGGRPTLERIRTEFGDGVAEIVEACSDTDVTPKPPWKARKEAYLAAIPHKSHQTRVVSLADKVHNSRCILSDYREIGDAVWTRFNEGRDLQLWYYRALADAFTRHEPGPLARRLEETVRELEAAVS
jgi:(p)ppGpp synthase/HD superfamily hydrolase